MLTLVNGEKLIVRESIDSVVEAILAYRARLLATVAQRVPAIGNLARAASLTSVDFTNRAGDAAKAVSNSSGSVT